MLRPGGHHPVGLIHALGGQVVGQHADVGHVPGENHRGFALQGQGRVHACHQALACGLLIAAGAVDLPGEVQPLHPQALKGGAQLPAVDAVIFNGIGQAGQLRPLQAGDGTVHLPLHILGQGGGHALHVPFPAGHALRLQENLVPVLVGKLDNLVLNAGAIAGARAVDFSAVQGRPV